ncbi:hypothetical protein [Arthrospiribacter ruber]|uniref:Uncharacterized protein n=1 Tax=Arthrospiribacter ruber TaxID=2487934 RepID=A0A951J063_9BACT|nr:hypothetical protein [Arthrospiribacter ruber]MBW3470340.1 hypothetical protein [Arthrospiribacter ruber]
MCFRGWGVIVPSTKYEGGRRKEQVLGFGVPGEGLDALIRTVFGPPLTFPVRRSGKEVRSTK